MTNFGQKISIENSERNTHRKFHKNQTENSKVFKISREKLWKKMQDVMSEGEQTCARAK